MKAEKTQKEGASRAIQREPSRGRVYVEDNRVGVIGQAKMTNVIQANSQLKGGGKIIQKQEITKDEAEAALAERRPVFKNLPHEILIPWGDEDDDTNCHGYTIHQAIGHSIEGSELIKNIEEDENIAIFTEGKYIAHSGRYVGNQLTHFLIGVGVLKSTINIDNTAGYENRFNLPDQRDELNTFLEEVAAENQQETRREIVSEILGYAMDNKLNDGAIFYDYQDLNDNDKDQFIIDHLDEINQLGEELNATYHTTYEEIQ